MSDGSGGAAPRQRLELTVAGMGCRHAVRSVTAHLRDVLGVETVVADPRAGVVTLTGTMRAEDLSAAIGDLPCRVAAVTGACGCPDRWRRQPETGRTVGSS